MTRRTALVHLMVISSAVMAAELPPSKWDITEKIKDPSAVCYDAASETYFVSSMAGDPTRSDGSGWISKYQSNGKVIKEKWVDGLNAPKGMRIAAGVLWVTDINRVIQIDLKTGAQISSLLISSARSLNDVALGPDGEAYISDTLTSRIYKTRSGMVDIFLQGDELESPSGLLVRNEKLYVAAWGRTFDFSNTTSGRLYSIDLKTKERENITAEPLGNLAGLEWDGKGFLVSDPIAGKVFRVLPDGKTETILSGIKGGDLGWASDSQTLVLPRTGEDRVSAFQL